MWFSGYCSPRYESKNMVGVYSEKCQMQLSSALALYTVEQSITCLLFPNTVWNSWMHSTETWSHCPSCTVSLSGSKTFVLI